MECTERNLIWRNFGPSTSRNLCPSITWILRKAQRWSKSALTFDRSPSSAFDPCRLHSVTELLVRTQHSFGLPLRMNLTHRAQTNHSSTCDLITHVLTFFHVKLTQNKAQHWRKSVCMDLARSPKPWVIANRQLKVAEINKRHRSWNH